MSLQGNATATELRGKINIVDVLCIDAYGVAVRNGFKGTEEEWLVSLKGDKGDNGKDGYSPYITVTEVDGGHSVYIPLNDNQGTLFYVMDGKTPQKGTDYFTEADKQEIVQEVTNGAIGDIDAALDRIIAIQESLIGGGV